MKIVDSSFLKYTLVDQNHIIRIGSIRDGGYFVTKRLIENSSFLISGGISYNAEFERDFQTINSQVKIIMIDGSFNLFSYLLRPFYWILFKKSYINKIPNLIDMLLLKHKTIFLKKYIGTPNGLTIQYIFNKFKLKEFGYLKLDIEGSEYDVLSDILDNKFRFTGLAIEFHNVPDNIDKINNFLIKLDLPLIGFCINETGGVNIKGIPNTIELSFAKKHFVDALEYDILYGKIFSNEAVNELLVPSKMEHKD